jgi:hypothetical protein
MFRSGADAGADDSALGCGACPQGITLALFLVRVIRIEGYKGSNALAMFCIASCPPAFDAAKSAKAHRAVTTFGAFACIRTHGHKISSDGGYFANIDTCVHEWFASSPRTHSLADFAVFTRKKRPECQTCTY